MATKNVNLSMVKGDTPRFTATVTDEVTGDPVDLTGASAWMTAKKEFADADSAAIFQKSVGDGITISNAVGGILTIDLAENDTKSLEEFFQGRRLLKYDLQIKTAIGQVFTVARGNLEVLEEATEAS